MVRRYGNGWLNMRYDIDTEVRMTKPSKSDRKVHGIEPIKYLVLPGTNTLFPQEFFIDIEGIKYEPKSVIAQHPTETDNVRYHSKELYECKVGEIYPMTLVITVADIVPERLDKGMLIYDSVNALIFEPGKLEKRIEVTKNKLFAALESAGLAIDESKIYYELSASQHNMDALEY
jgi:hypothetical protein